MVSHARETLPKGEGSGFSLRGFLARYTVLFALVVAFIAAFFVIDGMSPIMRTDGWEQHVRALAYYGTWLRAIARNLWEAHRLELPLYGMSLGYGSDVIGTLHYYVLGDPLTLVSALVPVRWTPILYTALIIVRMYLAGLAFAGFVTYAREDARTWSVVVAALCYVFFGYDLLTSVMHPYFVNPFIYFPLILWGVERVMKEQKPGLFIAAMFVASVSSFYFLYMLVLLTVPYILWRLCTTYGLAQPKELLAQGCRLLAGGILGAMLAAAVLLPAVLAFLSSSRSSADSSVDALYALSYYRAMYVGLSNSQIGLSAWASIGFNPVVVIALAGMLVLPGRRGPKLALVILAVGACLPFFGAMLNGFSYPSHRWYWALGLLGSYVLVDMWDDLKHLSRARKLALLVLLALYAAGLAYIAEHGGYPSASTKAGWQGLTGSWVALALAVAFVCCLLFTTDTGTRNQAGPIDVLMGALAVMAVFCNVFFIYSGRYGTYTGEFMDISAAKTMADTDAAALGRVDPMDELYRVAGDNLSINGSALGSVSSTQYYWSIASASADQYYREMGNNVSLSQRVYGLDARTALELLASVKYFVSDGIWTAPYGYERVTDFEGQAGLGAQSVWRNSYALPLGYCYDKAISRETYDGLTSVERQWALLQGVVLDNPEGLETVEPNLSCQNLAYNVILGDGAHLEEGAVVADQAGAVVTLAFEAVPNSETYLYVEGLVIEPNNPAESQLYLHNQFMAGNRELRHVVLAYRTPRHRWYEDRHVYAINSGYSVEGATWATITLPAAGRYRYDQFSVVAQPMEGYDAYAAALGSDTLGQVDMHYIGGIKATNHISGAIDLDEAKALVIALPYGDGWTATVDGRPQTLQRANTMFFGLVLDAGHHDIELSYQTPGLMLGLRLSALGGLLCLAWYGVRCMLSTRERAREGTPRHAR